MEIKSIMKSKMSGIINYTYFEDVDPMKNLKDKNLQSIHAFCFYKNKLVIAYAKDRKHWTPPSGGIEKGETFEEAVVREVKEETNMKVIYQELIGFIDFSELNKTIRQTRSFCIVEPYGDFVSDPDGDITEIKLIDPKDYKKYFDWGEVGDRIMNQAIKLNKKYNEQRAQ